MSSNQEEQLTFNEYEEKALSTAMIATPDYPFELLSEEVGEVAGKLSKFMRKHQVSKAHAVDTAAHGLDPAANQLHEDLEKELGDALWCIATAAYTIGSSLERIAKKNNAKLADRAARGKIDGKGDNR